MTAKEARELSVQATKVLDIDDSLLINDIFGKIKASINRDPSITQIEIDMPSKRVCAALVSRGFEIKEFRDRLDLYLIVGWGEDGVKI